MKSQKSNPFAGFPSNDSEWTQDDWKRMIGFLVDGGLVNYKEIAALTLGHLNRHMLALQSRRRKPFRNIFLVGNVGKRFGHGISSSLASVAIVELGWNFKQTTSCPGKNLAKQRTRLRT